MSGVLGLGILIGLVIAGSWNITPSGLATDGPVPTARTAVEQAVETGQGLEAVGSHALPSELLRPAPASNGNAAQLGGRSLREAAAKVRPAVVSVQVTRWRRGIPAAMRFNFENLPEEFRQRFRIPESFDEEQPRAERGEGSGFIISREGYILTNNHVVEGAAEVLVTLPDKRMFEAEVVGTDVITDVAVIKIDAGGSLPVVSLGDSESLQIGDAVLALGNPLRFNFTVTAGIVSARGRSLDIGPIEGNVRQMIQDFIQTDAAINRGNSGGPLVDMSGNVVGINTAIASSSGFNEGYGFAIPINLAKSVSKDLIEYGEVKRAWLGITFNEITAVWADAVSLPDTPPVGVVVQSVVPDGPAEKGGLQEEDIILKINGEPVENSGRLQTLVSTSKPGSRLRLEVYRGGSRKEQGERIELTVRLEERPRLERPGAEGAEEVEQPELIDPLGLELDDLSRQERRRFRFRGEGLLVEGVEQGGPFGNGVVNLVLVEVDRKPVPDLDTYDGIVEKLKKGEAVLVKFYNPGGPENDRYQTFAVRVP